MKDAFKITFILFAGIFLSAAPYLPANPTTQAMLAAVAKKRGSGGTFSQDLDTAGTDVRGCGNDSTEKYVGFQFSASNTGTVTSVTVHAQQSTGTPSGTFNVEIWTDDGGAGTAADPGTKIGTGVQYNVADLPDTYDTFTATGIDADITSGTLYWVVFWTNAVGANNRILIHFNAIGSNDLDKDDDAAADTWTVIDASALLRGNISGTTP